MLKGFNRNIAELSTFWTQVTGYFGTIADDMSKERRRRLRKLRRHPQLRDLIIDRLRAKWSPEQIAGRLLTDGISPVSICPETIHRFIYCKEDYLLGLYEHLPERRLPRGSHSPGEAKLADVWNCAASSARTVWIAITCGFFTRRFGNNTGVGKRAIASLPRGRH